MREACGALAVVAAGCRGGDAACRKALQGAAAGWPNAALALSALPQQLASGVRSDVEAVAAAVQPLLSQAQRAGRGKSSAPQAATTAAGGAAGVDDFMAELIRVISAALNPTELVDVSSCPYQTAFIPLSSASCEGLTMCRHCQRQKECRRKCSVYCTD